MNEKFFGRGVAMLLGVLLLTSTASAQVARHGWRGPERTGIYPETGLLKLWPASGPEQLWEVLDAGKGYSSPVVVQTVEAFIPSYRGKPTCLMVTKPT